MTLTIGILGTGDMGSAVGQMLRLSGHRVVTALQGRSELSRGLAGRAGLEDLESLENVLNCSDLFLSILPPALAVQLASDAAALIQSSECKPIYADCNAVSPATMERIAATVGAAGCRCVDVGIVGPPPRAGEPERTRFYVSGDARQSLIDLALPEIGMRDMGERIGRASALKMCYAAMNKGTNALFANLLLASRQLGVFEELMREFESSQTASVQRMRRRIPFLGAAAGRFTGEMAEIAATFDAAGVSGDFYRGAEWLYATLARSELGRESRSEQPSERSLELALEVFAAALEKSSED